MNTVTRITAYLVASIIISLFLSSCLERSEEITVNPDGSTTIELEFSGDATDFEPPISLPSEPHWEIVRHHLDSSTRPNPEIELQARKTVAYGDAFPGTFASEGTKYRDLALQFPTSVRRWTEGNRTYYEFTRTYRSRTFDAYNISEMDPFWDRDLEQQVLEKGVLALPKDKRDKYLSDFTFAYAYQQWRFMWEALAGLVRERLFDPKEAETVQLAAAKYLDQNLSEDMMLEIMQQKDEAAMGRRLDSLESTIGNHLRSMIISTASGTETSIGAHYDRLYERHRTNYRITEAISGHEFSVHLFLPGTIIETNGLVELDDPAGIIWWFKGDELHDADVTLRALSVVEK